MKPMAVQFNSLTCYKQTIYHDEVIIPLQTTSTNPLPSRLTQPFPSVTHCGKTNHNNALPAVKRS